MEEAVVEEVKMPEKENNNIRKMDDDDLRIGEPAFLRIWRYFGIILMRGSITK